MKTLKHFLFTIIFISLFSTFSPCQMVAISPFDVAPPMLLNDVKALRTTTPKMTTREFVEEANVLLASQGIPFTFTFDEATCTAIDKSIKSLKNAPARVNLRTKLSTVGGEPALLTLPPADFTNNECGKCSVTLPVLEIKEKEFVALMLGHNIKFNLPANFKVAEAALIDEKQLWTAKTTWRIPFRAKPLGVSFDGNVIYLGLPDAELKDLSLAVFSEGVFQFASREEAESNGKGNVIEANMPVYLPDPRSGYIVFDNRGAKQTVRFPEACVK